MTRLHTATASVLIATLQLGVGIALYRYRAFHRCNAGDWIVLYMPVVVAFVLHVVIWLPWRSFDGAAGDRFSLAIGATISAITFLVTLLINVNLFGS